MNAKERHPVAKGGTVLQCECGVVKLEVRGAPILTATCYCTSCRTAADQWANHAPQPILEDDQGTEFVLYRKDRLACLQGGDALTAHRLEPQSDTRRVLAGCCHTPMFLDFQHGHWASVYARRWPEAERPRPEMRTMTGDLPAGTRLSDDLPSPRTHTLGFYARLFGAWVRMGFRTPKLKFVGNNPS